MQVIAADVSTLCGLSVCLSVYQSVCMSVTNVSPTKTAELLSIKQYINEFLLALLEKSGNLVLSKFVSLNIWFPAPTQVHTLNCLTIGSAIFAHSSQLWLTEPQSTMLHVILVAIGHL